MDISWMLENLTTWEWLVWRLKNDTLFMGGLFLMVFLTYAITIAEILEREGADND